MRIWFLAGAGLVACATIGVAQQDSAAPPPRVRAVLDTVLAQEAIYNRPFIASVGRTGVGGYVEGNTNYFRTDGVSDGFSMELRRFNVFLFGALGSRFRFISELEFENGAEEIRLETALLDFIINPSFVMRAGVLLPPIGQFNVRHDAPLWDVIDRPLVSTEIIPATLSEPGFGVHGRLYPGGFTMTYDAYLTNGLGAGVILNDLGRTRLASGKSAELFSEDNNRRPAFSTRLAGQHRLLGEVGLSYYGGAYNAFQVEGETVDDRRSVQLAAVDWSTVLLGASVRGEMAWAWIDVPPDLQEVYGSRQWGFFVDVVRPVLRPRILGLRDATVSLLLRAEMVDFNRGTFSSTGASIGDEIDALTLGASFRPISGTVFKFNYRYERVHDLQGNAPVRRAGFQVGLATYF